MAEGGWLFILVSSATIAPKRGAARVVSVTFSNESDWDDSRAGAGRTPRGLAQSTQVRLANSGT